MAILDYTTKVSVAKTVAEIEGKLAKAKAEAILKEYDSDRMVSALSFRIRTEFGVLTFLLPANIQRVYLIIARDSKIPRSLRTKEQAARIAWRIVKDWIEAQLAMIEAGLVDLEQVFLPYAQDAAGRTAAQTKGTLKSELKRYLSPNGVFKRHTGRYPMIKYAGFLTGIFIGFLPCQRIVGGIEIDGEFHSSYSFWEQLVFSFNYLLAKRCPLLGYRAISRAWLAGQRWCVRWLQGGCVEY